MPAHPRSLHEFTGCGLHASVGEIKHVEDFIVDVERWVLRYMVIDSRNWLPGRKILIGPTWVNQVVCSERAVHVGMTRRTVRESPEFDPSHAVNREYEIKLHDDYGRPVYWK